MWLLQYTVFVHASFTAVAESLSCNSSKFHAATVFLSSRESEPLPSSPPTTNKGSSRTRTTQSCRCVLFLKANRALTLPPTPVAERAWQQNSKIAESLLFHLSLSLHISLTDIVERLQSLSLSVCEILYLSVREEVMPLQRCISILLLLRLNI